jgi:hypothetical protein
VNPTSRCTAKACTATRTPRSSSARWTTDRGTCARTPGT